MKDKLRKQLVGLVSVVLGLVFLFQANAYAAPSWQDKLDEGKLRPGIALATSTGVSVTEIAWTSVEENYPVCDILVAMLKEKIEVHQALTSLIKAGGNLEHLAICCAEPGVNIPSAVFAKVALDSGIDEEVVDHLLRIAFTPVPGESGTFTRESVVAGGEIREGPFTSPFTFDSPFPSFIKR